MEFATKTIHAGQPSEPETGSLVAPIFQTSTYEQNAPGCHRGFDYSRTNNPTRSRLKCVLADLERRHARRAVRVGSGGRERRSCRPTSDPATRSSSRWMCTAARFGSSTGSFSRSAVSSARSISVMPPRSRPRSRAGRSWCGSNRRPTPDCSSTTSRRLRRRPTGRRAARRRQHVCDPVVSAAVSARRGSGCSQRDEVPRRSLRSHSGRGARARSRGFRTGQFLQNATGAVPSPFDCWLTLRGLKTLELRMQRHAENAEAIAHALKLTRSCARVFPRSARSSRP